MAAPHRTVTRLRPASTRSKRVVALAVTGSLSAASLVLAAGSAAANHGEPVSQAEGRFLSGSVLGENLDSYLSLEPAQARNFGGPVVTEENPLSATALSSVVVPLGPVTLLGDNGILELGAVNQVAIARPDGSSVGASGAVTNAGAIEVGGSSAAPGDATLELDGLLPGAGVLTDLDLSIGALSARATQAPGVHGNQATSYQIADLELRLDSTVVSGLLDPLLGEQDEVDGITQTLNGLELGVVSVENLPVLSTIVAGLSTQTSPDGSLTVDLSSGVVTVDLEEIINLNNLPRNTPLLPYILTALNTQLVPAVEAGLAELTADIEATLDDVTASANLAGIVTPIPAGTLSGVLDTVLAGLTLSPAAVATGTFDNAISDLLGGVLRLTANYQPELPNTHKPAGSAFVDEFTVTALRVQLLAEATAADLRLASASVGPNYGELSAHPFTTGIDPDHGPTAGGTAVTITGTNFFPGSTVSVDGGPVITPDAINGDGTQLVYTAPAHAAGPVDVTVNNGNGTSAPRTYTYVPPNSTTTIAPPVITEPDDGDETEDNTPPIAGTGTPGATVTVREGGTVLCTAVVRANGTWTCTPGTALSNGSHTITATQSANGRTSTKSNSVTFRIVVDGNDGDDGNDGNGDGDDNGNDNDNDGLPNTGGNSSALPFGVAGLALLLTGLGLTAAHRRATGG